MGKRGKQNWDRALLPVGTIRLRASGKQKVHMVKVRLDGPKGRRWIDYARWWWERNRGSVPRGKRVLHRDGNCLNDSPDNLVLGTPADAAAIWHHHHPEGSAENFRKMRLGTARANRARAALGREIGFLSTWWYPVDHARRLIHNAPVRKRWMVYGEVARSKNGAGWVGFALGWPGLPRLDALVLAALVEAARPLSGAEALQAAAALGAGHSAGFDVDKANCRGSLFHRLRRAGLLCSFGPARRREHQATPAAVETRGPVLDVVPVRGRDLIYDGRYESYEKRTPAAPPMERVLGYAM